MKLRTKLIIAFVVVMIFPVTFALIAMHAFVPGRGAEIQQLYLIAVVLTTAFLILWIYRSVSVPLQKLQRAARNIKEGNLDFEIKAESNDEIGQPCQDFEAMRLRLKAQAEEKVAFDRENKELISNISHDLKTPITAIKGYVEGIMDGVADTPEKIDRYIKTIFNVLSVELESKGAEFTYRNFMEEDSKVIVDPEQLRRVINNIVSNSIKYTDKPKVKITMDVKDVGDFIQVELGDNGKGIAAKDLPNIFDRFYRTDASRNSSKGGSGIGLSIVKKIMEDHGGKVWATSRLGIGTIMYFVLRKYQEVPMNE